MFFDIPFYQLFILSVNGLLKIFFNPLFYLVIFMVYWQLKNLAVQQEQLFGQENLPLLYSVLDHTAKGLLAGIFASLLVLVTGLSINQLGVEYIWPLALMLLLVNVRFLCFAYAGGFLAIANALFGWPEIAASHVLALVAILHITESVLVFFGGSYSQLPVYLKFKNQAVGGFLLSNYWPLPLLLLVAMGVAEEQTAQMLAMPEWWPLYPVPDLQVDSTTNVLMPITIAAVLGYSSISLTTSPTVKRRFSAFVLLVYSLVLLALSYFSIANNFYAFLAGMFSIFGHELAVYLDQKFELSRKPLYVYQPDKYRVLAAIFDSPLQKAGLHTNDIIVSIAKKKIYTEEDLKQLLPYLPGEFEVEVLRAKKIVTLKVKLSPPEKELGIIRMPQKDKDTLLTFQSNYSLVWRWYKKFKRYRALKYRK